MLKILLIEDNDNIRENTSEILMLAGYKVFSANSGEQGLLFAAQVTPDLIICDIVMHGMNGFEVFSELKLNSELRDIPFVFLTAKTDKSELKTGMELGANDYITKPFDSEQLLMAVAANIKKGGRASQTIQQSPSANAG